jgi:hypothetical protein
MTELQKKARGLEWIVTVDRSQYLSVVYRFTHAPQQPCLLSHTFPQKSPLPSFPPTTMACMLESHIDHATISHAHSPRVSDKR